MGHTAHTIAKVDQRHKPTFALPKAQHCAMHGRTQLLSYGPKSRTKLTMQLSARIHLLYANSRLGHLRTPHHAKDQHNQPFLSKLQASSQFRHSNVHTHGLTHSNQAHGFFTKTHSPCKITMQAHEHHAHLRLAKQTHYATLG